MGKERLDNRRIVDGAWGELSSAIVTASEVDVKELLNVRDEGFYHAYADLFDIQDIANITYEIIVYAWFKNLGVPAYEEIQKATVREKQLVTRRVSPGAATTVLDHSNSLRFWFDPKEMSKIKIAFKASGTGTINVDAGSRAGISKV